MPNNPKCWCSDSPLEEFSPDYLRCPECETLVLRNFPARDLTVITDECADLYGANYAERHLQSAYGYPDLALRARYDLPERCLHWLRGILKYKLPPAALLELGSFHGGFVGLAGLAGYQVHGLDLSPKLAEEAARRFDVKILVGSIERQNIAAGSLDVIAMFDVLEHLQDPEATLRRCRELLKPDGILVMQTPRYPEKRTYAEMLDQKDLFLIQLKPAEHLYLFSQSSVERLLRRTGFPQVQFEHPIFNQYDMFPFASATQLRLLDRTEQTDALQGTPRGRFALALMDLQDTGLAVLHDHIAHLKGNFDIVEQDRLARGKVIEEQGRRSIELERLIWLTEENRNWWKGEAERLATEVKKTHENLSR